MCGFSGSEFVLVLLVTLVVTGPKDLPKMLRKLGQWAGKARRLAADLRAQSGIDDALRSEGLADDIAEIRKLARGELDVTSRATRGEPLGAVARDAVAVPSARADTFVVAREREYPRDGADTYGCLPETAIVYADGLPKSKLARDPLYVLGDANAELPPEPEPMPEPVPEAEPVPEPASTNEPASTTEDEG